MGQGLFANGLKYFLKRNKDATNRSLQKLRLCIFWYSILQCVILAGRPFLLLFFNINILNSADIGGASRCPKTSAQNYGHLVSFIHGGSLFIV